MKFLHAVSSLKRSDATRVPATIGAKRTEMVQLLPLTSLAPVQVFAVMAKSAVSGPLKSTLLMVSAVDDGLLTVTCLVCDWPTATKSKVTVPDETNLGAAGSAALAVKGMAMPIAAATSAQSSAMRGMDVLVWERGEARSRCAAAGAVALRARQYGDRCPACK